MILSLSFGNPQLFVGIRTDMMTGLAGGDSQ